MATRSCKDRILRHGHPQPYAASVAGSTFGRRKKSIRPKTAGVDRIRMHGRSIKTYSEDAMAKVIANPMALSTAIAPYAPKPSGKQRRDLRKEPREKHLVHQVDGV